MIAYEELEKALVRWKTRRTAPSAETTPPPTIISETSAAADADIPSGITDENAPVNDSTGELEISDAIIDES